MTRAQTFASRFRWLLFAAAMLCWAAGLVWLIYPVYPGNNDNGQTHNVWGLLGVIGWMTDSEGFYTFVIAAYFGVFLLSQWFFLGPRGGWRVRLKESGRPMKSSAIAAALAAALLSVGFLATLAQFCGFWQKIVGDMNGQSSPTSLRYWPLLIALAVSWLVWAIIFLVYWKSGNHGTQLSRMLRGLFGGSVLELLVTAPVHALAMRDKDQAQCYCATGSYTGLVLGGTVLLWTFGPGLVLLFLREKERREPLLSPAPA